MSDDNATPITDAKKINTATAVRIERLRQRLLTEAMPFVETTRRALDQDNRLNEREVLYRAFKVMDEIALELNEVSGINGPLPQEEDD